MMCISDDVSSRVWHLQCKMRWCERNICKALNASPLHTAATTVIQQKWPVIAQRARILYVIRLNDPFSRSLSLSGAGMIWHPSQRIFISSWRVLCSRGFIMRWFSHWCTHSPSFSEQTGSRGGTVLNFNVLLSPLYVWLGGYLTIGGQSCVDSSGPRRCKVTPPLSRLKQQRKACRLCWGFYWAEEDVCCRVCWSRFLEHSLLDCTIVVFRHSYFHEYT